MKEYFLYKDGTCKKGKSHYSCDIKYKLLDVSSIRKGPLYTLTSGSNFQEGLIQRVEIDVQIGCDDSPSIGDIQTICICPKKEVSKYVGERPIPASYKILPLIKGIDQFSNFISENGLGFYEIGDVRVWLNGEDHTLTSDNKVTKFFRNHSISTCVHSIGYESIIGIYPQCEWRIFSLDDIESAIFTQGFHKFFIPIPYTESGYLLSRWYIYDLLSIKFITIHLYEKKYGEIFTISVSDLPDILALFLYVPQLVLLEQRIYDEPVSILLEVEKDGCCTRSLYISEEEGFVDHNICLYDILTKLLLI